MVALEVVGYSIFSLAAVALYGYILGNELAFGWGNLTRMAVHTAAGFIVLGVGVLVYANLLSNQKLASIPLWIPATVCLAGLLFDLSLPIGVTAGIVYLLFVFCALWVARETAAFVFAGISTLLIVLGYFASPDGGIPWIVLTNRSLAIAALWIAAVLVYFRKRAEAAQRASEGRLTAIFDSAADGIITIDPKGGILSFNNAAEQIFGYTEEEVLGKNVKMLMPDPYQSEHDGYLARYHETGERRIIGFPLEVLGQRRDGTVFPLELAISEVKTGEDLVFTGIVRDVSARKEAEFKAQELTDRLARSNSELEQFAYVSSHDLQAPIRAIVSYSQYLKTDIEGKHGDDVDMYIDRTIRAAKHMQTLISGLLAFSRVDRKGGEFVETDCNAVLENVLNNLHAAITESGANVTVDTLASVHADTVQISSLFQNLVENAIKFSGETTPEIRISSEEDNGMHVFSVRDHGIGIDPKNSDRIFQIFKRLHSQKEVPGTGVGLSICKKIVNRHGGRIWVDVPDDQHGTVFRFTLPTSLRKAQ